MIPWERDVYVGLLVKHIKEEKEKAPLEQRIKLDVLFYSKGSISSIPALHQHEPKTCFVKTNSELLIGFLTKPLQPPQFA